MDTPSITTTTTTSNPHVLLLFNDDEEEKEELLQWQQGHCLELRWNGGGSQQNTKENRNQVDEVSALIGRLLEAMRAKEHRLANMLDHLLDMLSSQAEKHPPIGDIKQHNKMHSAQREEDSLRAALEAVRVQFSALRSRRLAHEDTLATVALGGYRSLLLELNACIRHAYSFIVPHHGEALGRRRLQPFSTSIQPTISLLEQFAQALRVCSLLPADANNPYMHVSIVEGLVPESVHWRIALQPCHIGYEYSKELNEYVKQLNIFFAAMGQSYQYANFLMRQTIFSSYMLKYAIAPREAARQATEYKKNISLGFLRAAWNILEEPLYHWFAISLGYTTNNKVAVEKVIEIPAPEPLGTIKAQFVWEAPKHSSPSVLQDLASYLPFFSSSHPSNHLSQHTAHKNTEDRNPRREAEKKPSSFMNLSFNVPKIFKPASEEESELKDSASSTEVSDKKDNEEAFTCTSGKETAVKIESHSTETKAKHEGPGPSNHDIHTHNHKESQSDGHRSGNMDHKGSDCCLVFHVHGGGFISQSTVSHMSYVKQWASLTHLPIFSVDYSLAPEHPYPKAHEEVFAAYKWVISNYQSLGIRGDGPLKVVLVGDSAGANLVAGITIRAIKEGLPLPVGMQFIYPALNLALAASVSRILFNHDPLINYPSTSLCFSSYLPGDLQKLGESEALVSPVLAEPEVLAQWPATDFFAGGLDPLLDDAAYFAHRLQSAGRPVSLHIYDGLPHGFLNVLQSLPSARSTILDSARSLMLLASRERVV